jgi:hypothetical protein
MKKIILYTIALGLLLATSCKKDEIGGTATESMAGEWYVTINVIIDEEVYIDPYNYGNIHLDTYNTAANSATEMWIDDNGNFWQFKVKAAVDLATKTFQATDARESYYYEAPDECFVTISGGKILPGAATTPGKSPADSIVFNATFSDDPDGYIYQFTGYRYTGLKSDE